METKFQTSFIPKQPVTESSPHHTSAASLFFLFSFIVFMTSLAGAAAVFIYSTVTESRIKSEEVSLTRNKNAFDPNTIKELIRLNDRINAADALLKQHKSVSTLFQVLGNTTLKTVRFGDFNYSGSEDKITLSMRGQAFNYETIALQAKAFTDPQLKNVFRSPILTDLSLDPQGNVSFSFSTGIDPFLVDYYKLKTEEYAQGGTNSTAVSTPATSAPTSANSGFSTTSDNAIINTSSGNGGNTAGSAVDTSNTGAGAPANNTDNTQQ